MSAHRSIPVYFVPGHLAVNDGRSERAKKDAFYKFCTKHGIKPEPGRVFPLKKIEAACAG